MRGSVRAMHVRTDVFERVLCGVDGSDAGAEAAWIAARVVDQDGPLVLATVHDPSLAVHAGWMGTPVAGELAEAAKQASERGREEAGSLHVVETRLLEGHPLDALQREIERVGATLVVVGMHGDSRMLGITLGSVATHVLHEASCSVLVARPPRDRQTWPRTIVVGVDGSRSSKSAFAAASHLATRLGATLRPVVATKEPLVDLEAARELAPGLETIEETAVHALHVLSEEADLVVVGNRGLRGIRALGSVGERIAHEARCSVLVVREPVQ
jgi:nucleotide-binding universal stress UspA family protein